MARPLIKKDQKGVLYVRPPSIEAKIDEAIVQDWETLSKRVKITDPNDPDFLMRDLRPAYREVLTMKYLWQLTWEEVAIRLGLSQAGARKRADLARKEILSKHGPGKGDA